MKKYFIILSIIFLFSLVSSDFYNSVNNIQYTNPSINSIYGGSASSYWSGLANEFDESNCADSTDIVLMIPPAGCEPMTVRSDLLAERNVQVFCKLSSIRVNPLIKISAIKTISFAGKMPDGVLGVSFYPARAALRSYNTLVGDPLYNDVGYVVITLKKNPNENSMPKFIGGNLTARISYDAESAYGVGDAVLYLEESDFSDANSNSNMATFWNGKGYLRLLDVDLDLSRARVGIYSQGDTLVGDYWIEEGKSSPTIYFPGFYCKSNFKIKLSEFTSPDDSALLNVDGDSVWVRKGSKILDGRCEVRNIRLVGPGSGSVELYCQGSGKIELSIIEGLTANISVGDGSKYYNLTDVVFGGNISSRTGNLRWRLAYSGMVGGAGKEQPLVILLGSDSENLKSNVYSELSKKIYDIGETNRNSGKDVVVAIKNKLSISGFKLNESMIVLGESDSIVSISGEIKLNNLVSKLDAISADAESTSGVTSEIAGYLREADNSVKELIDDYKEVRSEFDRYSEIALLDEINLVKPYGDSVDRISLMKKFLEEFPDSAYYNTIASELSREVNYDTTNTVSSFEINGKMYSIVLDRFRESDKSSKKAGLYIDSKWNGSHKENDEIILSIAEKILISKINPTNIEVDAFVNSSRGWNRVSSFIIRNGEEKKQLINGKNYIFEIGDIDVPIVAKIELDTETQKTSTSSNFSYKIGIEQRTIKLNPNKSSEKAEKLNKTIEKMQKKLDSLGKVVETMQGVCYITNLALTAKNLITGTSGESMARQEVMKYWKGYCDTNAIDTQFGVRETNDACYLRMSPFIDSDVKIYTEAIEDINKQIGTEKNISKFVAGLVGTIDNITIGGGSKSLSVSDLDNWDAVRAYLLYEKVKDTNLNGGIIGQIKNERDIALAPIINSKERRESEHIDGVNNLNDRENNIGNRVWDGRDASSLSNMPGGVDKNDPIYIGSRNGKTYLLILQKTKGDEFGVKFIYVNNTTTGNWTMVNDGNDYNELNRIRFSSSGNCVNENLNPTVSYYDSGSAKGLAAVVPFDKNNGWYARVSASQGGLFSDESKGYSDSGSVNTFSICNVGQDGRQTPDDACTTVNINTAGDSNNINSIAGCKMDNSEMRRLIVDAQDALRQAGKQYNSRERIVISISGRGSFYAERGSPTGMNGPIEQCQDFMSPENCNLMFNVCDPVMCPTSRCDLGGTYPVTNVIQSGIVGSLLLCLPNFKLFGGDVYIPVCLSGVHAGLDAYLSILKAQRDCLQENAKDGSYVGMCDYMTAVYKCNLFWNQAQPIISNFAPNIFSLLTGGQKQGGGEYLTFQKSWNNMQASLDYFSNTYGKNSFTQFRAGDTQEFGTEFCNAFVGTSFPTSAKGFKEMLRPVSPYQLYAEFQEIPHTDATVPPTSHYKVFAHIYAGNDSGLSYSIYLKSPPDSGYYAGIPYINVETGYVTKGDYRQISKDFTAPAGYKELCVSINGEEKCGFGKVTTDFAVNALSQAYMEKQVEQTKITTEKECQEGTSGVIGFTSINPQAAIENVVDPRIDLKGIIRVCSSVNPGGEGGSKSSKWKNVGYCGDPNMVCWLDEDSVKNTVSQIWEVSKDYTQAEDFIRENEVDGVLDEESSLKLANDINNEIANLKNNTIDDKKDDILGNITNLVDKGYSSFYQAKGVYLRFKLYETIVRIKKGGVSSLNKVSIPGGADTKPNTLLSDLEKGNVIKDNSGNRFIVNEITRDASGKFVIAIRETPGDKNGAIEGIGSDSLSSKGYSLA